MRVVFFWFRRDLRLRDNHGLYRALRSGHPVVPVFIFDEEILRKLNNRADRRVSFIRQQLSELNDALQVKGSSLITRYGTPLKVWKQLLKDYPATAVFANHDYEPYARERDEGVQQFLSKQKVPFHTFKDQVIFEKSEIVKNDGTPYTVFTPYRNKWIKHFRPESFPSQKHTGKFLPMDPQPLIRVSEMGFEDWPHAFHPPKLSITMLRDYASKRDFPGLDATSRLSVHLRFGTVSIRQVVAKAQEVGSNSFLDELVWRDFYQMIIWHFPQVENSAFKFAYDFIPWRNHEEEFLRWCEGNTGYPIVDAGMRELNATGFMHNRVRMITASFLVKHLLIDWRWGEAYFAEKLLDFDLAANNGGWQWAAGSGCDAAPYFRIFNPAEQIRKFDPDFRYIKKWVPEFQTACYPAPMVDHAFARERCLGVFKKALANRGPKA